MPAPSAEENVQPPKKKRTKATKKETNGDAVKTEEAAEGTLPDLGRRRSTRLMK
ncbi:Uncharacterized protein LW93_943 [Fusarium fujikuroi]|nr:Uncharacterized protein LW93_943 [Fusarium fujikuroi]